MERVEVPKALGKSAAISRLLAQGGTPFKMSGRYKKGKFKGLTVDEATARAEVLWENSPDSLKQRYADRTTGKVTDLAPSERVAGMTPAPVTNASLNAARPGETPAQMAARQRASRMTGTTPARSVTAPKPYDKDRNGVPDMIQRPAAPTLTSVTPAPPQASTQPQPPALASVTSPGSSFTELTPAQKPPADGIKSVGDGSSAENGWTPQFNAIGDDGNIKAPKLVVGVNPAPGRQTPPLDSPAPPGVRPSLQPKAPAVLSESDAGQANTVLRSIGSSQTLTPGVQPAPAGVQPPTTLPPRNQPGPFAVAPSTTQPQSVGEPVASTAPAPAATIGTPSRIGATPAGMELTGMGWKRDAAGNPTKEREAKYAPIAEVYGAPKTASIQTTGGRITGGTRQTDEQQRAGYQRSQSQQPDMTARAVQPPRAIPVTPSPPSAADRYATAQTAYQSELDPAKAQAMDSVYANANPLEKAQISGNVMKRAAGLNRQPLLPGSTPSRGISTPSVMPGVAQSPTKFQPANSSGLNAAPIQPRRGIIPGSTRPRFAMAGR